MQPTTTVMAPPESAPDSRFGFPIRRIVEIGAVAILLVLLYARTMAGLADDWWNQESFSQGMLLPPLAFYFAWLDRKALFALPVQPSRSGLWLVLAGCFMFLAGKLAAEFFSWTKTIPIGVSPLDSSEVPIIAHMPCDAGLTKRSRRQRRPTIRSARAKMSRGAIPLLFEKNVLAN